MLPALSDPYAPVRYIARSPGEVDEEFLDQFTWAPGCWTYFLSRAMWLFLVGSIGVRLFDTLLGLWSGTIQSGDVGSGLLALLLGLVELAAFFGLLIWAGKVGRRRRWEQLNWRDFETFRKDEAARQTLGIVFWALQIFLIAGSIFKGLTGAGSGGP
jgi:hypothetical protein